jgi:hypothetical protein
LLFGGFLDAKIGPLTFKLEEMGDNKEQLIQILSKCRQVF